MGSTLVSGVIRPGFFSGSSGLEASLYLKLTGGTMVGPLILHGDPTLPLEAATKQYVDAHSKDHVSISLAMPSQFIVAGSPAAYDGTFTVTLADQSPHMVFAGPNNSTLPAAPPSFRALIAADISDLDDVTDLYLPLAGGTMTGPLTVNDDVTVNGDLDATGILLNGSPIAHSVFGRTGAVTAQSGDYTANLVTLSPAISSWTDVQGALTGIDLMLNNLSRGMAYVGSYDAAGDVATFVPAMASLSGPLPAANAAGLHAGDFLICTSALATFPGGPVQVGDQLISDGPGGGTAWNVLKVGQATITAGMVPLSPVVRTWNTVQAAIEAIDAGATQTPWAQNIDANARMLCSGAGNSLMFATGAPASPTERMRIDASGNVGIGVTAPLQRIDVAGSVRTTGSLLLATATDYRWAIAKGGTGDDLYIRRYNDAGTAATMVTVARDTGWVGIGSTAPEAMLFLYENLATPSPYLLYVHSRYGTAAGTPSAAKIRIGFNNYTSAESRFYQLGCGDPVFGSLSNFGIREEYTGNVIVFANPSGNFGVGTTSPGTTIHANSAGNCGIRMQTVQATANYCYISWLKTGVLEWWMSLGGSSTGSDLVIHNRTESRDLFACKPNGNITIPNGHVGIGSTLGNLYGGSTNFVVGPGSNRGWILLFGNATSTPVNGISFCNQALPSESRIAEINCHVGASNTAGNLVFCTRNAETQVQERMRIVPNGSVGIGTNNPLRLLHLSGGDIVWDSEGSILPTGTPGPTLFTGTANVNQDRYLSLINSPYSTGASGLKAGGILCADTYAYAMPGKNDLIVKGSVAVGMATAGTAGVVYVSSLLRVGALPAANAINCRIVNDGVVWTQHANEVQRFAMRGGDGYIDFQRFSDAGVPTTFFSLRRSDGFVGIGRPTPDYMLHVGIDSAGKPGTNTWTIASDVRTKRNIQPFQGGMEVIRKLEPQVAEYNGKANCPEGLRVVSLDPEKLRKVIPAAVSSVRGKLDESDKEETDILGVNTHEIFYHMLLALQQLDKRLERLKA